MGNAGIQIAHYLPGRVRIKIARLKGNSALAEVLQQRLGAVHGVRQVTVNLMTGSVVVLYEAGELASPDALMALAATMTALVPEGDLSALAAGLASFGRGAVEDPTVLPGFFAGLNAEVRKVTGGVDLRLLLPLTLVCFGIRGLLVAEELTLPAWYDLLWFGFGTFVMLHADAPDQRSGA